MDRGKAHSEVEKAAINAYKILRTSNRDVAQLITRSIDAVNRYVKNRGKQVAKKKPGARPKLSDRDKRRIVAAATQTTKGCRRIRNEVTPYVSKSTVHRVLKNSPQLVGG